jgi:hypothetical protein
MHKGLTLVASSSFGVLTVDDEQQWQRQLQMETSYLTPLNIDIAALSKTSRADP